MKLVDGVRRWLGRATQFFMWVGAAGVLLMMLLVILDVSLKYVINQPVPGTLEMVSFYFMAACAFLPFARVQKDNHHIVMTLATEKLGPVGMRRLMTIVRLVSAAYLFVFAYAAAGEAAHMTAVGESTGAVQFDVLIWPARWFVPAGTGLMGLWMLMQLVQSFLLNEDTP